MASSPRLPGFRPLSGSPPSTSGSPSSSPGTLPDAAALEDLYVGANPRTILSVGQARGAVLAACGLAGLDAAGYPPAEVKKSVCGFGRADKGQMLRMVTAILGLDPPPATDHAADALAVAVCHATRARASTRVAVAG